MMLTPGLRTLRCALMEQTLGITGTYYVRTVPGAWNEDVIREIYRLGHESDITMKSCGCRRQP
jgi:hypothetical protein